jgi:hypothetical protein
MLENFIQKKSLNLLNRSIFFILISIYCFSFITYKQAESITSENEKPFWLPLRLDVGEDYFKVNVFVLGVNENTGLIKVCANSTTSSSSLCHYMDANEEGQIIHPFVSVHAGIFVFPSYQVPENSIVNVCVTIISNNSNICKNVTNSIVNREEMVDIDIGGL